MRSRRSRLIARDVYAGLTVALVLIPQAVGYAEVAGMPPVSGLYAAALPPLAAAVFASSPYLQTGPVAVTSLLTFGVLASRAPPGSDAYVELGVTLALVVGAARVLIGMLRAGAIANLLSEPMLMGFLPAAAVLICASQLPGVFGTGTEGGVLSAGASALVEPGRWDAVGLALASATIALVTLGRRFDRPALTILLAVLAGLLVGAALSESVATVGPIPAGLPDLRLDLAYGELPSLLIPGIGIALIGFAEAAAIGRTYATRERAHWSANREFMSQGAANLAAGIAGGFPVGGSLSRSALNHEAGAASKRSGAITGLAVLVFLPFAALLDSLPRAVLGAIVIWGAVSLIRPRRIVALWRVSRPQFLVAGATFALTLILAPHVEWAVLAGIGVSIGVHLARELPLRIEVSVDDDVLNVRAAGVLWFATGQDLHDRLTAELARHRNVTKMRLSLDGLGRIDLTAAMALGQLLDEFEEMGIEVELCAIPSQARSLIERYQARRGVLEMRD